MYHLKLPAWILFKELLKEVPTSANIKHYSEIVSEKSLLRKLIKINEEISNTCYSGKESLEEIMDKTEKSVFWFGTK